MFDTGYSDHHHMVYTMLKTCSKPFWVKCKPSFSDKHSKAYTNIVLNEKDDNIFKNKEITNTFNEYFGFIVEWLDLHIWTEGSSNILLSYTSDGGINHPSIKTIKHNFNITKTIFV